MMTEEQLHTSFINICDEYGVSLGGLYESVAKELAHRAMAAERGRWHRPAFLWPVVMPDDVARWISAQPPEVVPRDQMQRVEWPNV